MLLHKSAVFSPLILTYIKNKIQKKHLLKVVKVYLPQLIMLKTIYSVEGNIGSGKSTLLALIQKQVSKTIVFPEPVAEWQKISEFNLLDEYYKDPHRWAYTFQINAITTRMKGLRDLIDEMEKKNGFKYFSERSIIADKEIFAKMLHQQKKMSPLEYQLYMTLFESLNSLFKIPKQHKFIYLRTQPNKCLTRVQKRNRYEEKTIPLAYLEEIHSLHEKWLASNPNSITIDGTIEFQNDQERISDIMSHIEDFIHS